MVLNSYLRVASENRAFSVCSLLFASYSVYDVLSASSIFAFANEEFMDQLRCVGDMSFFF